MSVRSGGGSTQHASRMWSRSLASGLVHLFSRALALAAMRGASTADDFRPKPTNVYEGGKIGSRRVLTVRRDLRQFLSGRACLVTCASSRLMLSASEPLPCTTPRAARAHRPQLDRPVCARGPGEWESGVGVVRPSPRPSKLRVTRSAAPATYTTRQCIAHSRAAPRNHARLDTQTACPSAPPARLPSRRRWAPLNRPRKSPRSPRLPCRFNTARKRVTDPSRPHKVRSA
ncbi:hypothetical protein B0H15DRAFT_952392 [Mycena belliarum]|uniref:Uncharacterized protein n=1 Tax=Mycena belliarum TaxID=1033014 RepID=A0AAD6TYF0_9AGAR|nr:hypothetical protein B0H15DRAFT_952392 [Mycena belliae]